MAKVLKLRRGTTSQHSSFTGAEGEVTVDTTKDTIVIHDGSTAGGRPMLREDVSNLAAGAIVHASLAGDAVDGDNLADNAVDSEHYTDGSIDHVHLAADAVDGDNIADDSINSEHYVDGSIDTAHIADDQITLAKLAGIARGKIIYGDASGNPAVLAPGSSGQVLESDAAKKLRPPPIPLRGPSIPPPDLSPRLGPVHLLDKPGADEKVHESNSQAR